jgi:hypothetical protein
MFKIDELVFFNHRDIDFNHRDIDDAIITYLIIKGKEYKSMYYNKRVKRIQAKTMGGMEKQPITDYISKVMLFEELDEI